MLTWEHVVMVAVMVGTLALCTALVIFSINTSKVIKATSRKGERKRSGPPPLPQQKKDVAEGLSHDLQLIREARFGKDMSIGTSFSNTKQSRPMTRSDYRGKR